MKTVIYDGSDPVVWGPTEKWLDLYKQERHTIIERILQTNSSNIIYRSCS